MNIWKRNRVSLGVPSHDTNIQYSDPRSPSMISFFLSSLPRFSLSSCASPSILTIFATLWCDFSPLVLLFINVLFHLFAKKKWIFCPPWVNKGMGRGGTEISSFLMASLVLGLRLNVLAQWGNEINNHHSKPGIIGWPVVTSKEQRALSYLCQSEWTFCEPQVSPGACNYSCIHQGIQGTSQSPTCPEDWVGDFRQKDCSWVKVETSPLGMLACVNIRMDDLCNPNNIMLPKKKRFMGYYYMSTARRPTCCHHPLVCLVPQHECQFSPLLYPFCWNRGRG